MERPAKPGRRGSDDRDKSDIYYDPKVFRGRGSRPGEIIQSGWGGVGKSSGVKIRFLVCGMTFAIVVLIWVISLLISMVPSSGSRIYHGYSNEGGYISPFLVRNQNPRAYCIVKLTGVSTDFSAEVLVAPSSDVTMMVPPVEYFVSFSCASLSFVIAPFSRVWVDAGKLSFISNDGRAVGRSIRLANKVSDF